MLPRGDEYNGAVQNPKVAFSDLKSSSVEETPLGLPKPYSGGFTITYKLSNNKSGWAVRCFHRDIQDLQRRYQAIGDFFRKTPSKYFVEAKYLAEGIKVNGKGYPIIKMLWLDGEPLNIYLTKNYNQRKKVDEILSDFINLIDELDRLGIAHGDLQHGNIIIKNDKLFLIDYDGMYFPELASLQTNEIGHINYQHPQRSASDFNPRIDRFSSIVIYIGLKAISLKPNLWKKYDNGENILFRSQDFSDLQHSELIQDLSAIQEIKPLVERLIGCCHLNFEKVPSLRDFLSGNFTYDKNAVGTITITRSQYEVIDATKKGSLLEHFGEKVEVVGLISGNHSGSTYHRLPYIFLNFGVYPKQSFTLVVWQEGLVALTAKGMSPASLVGKYVSVTGVIGSYGGKPQMIIEQPTQIQILAGEKEANQRLKYKSPVTITPPITQVKNPPTAAVKKVTDKEASVFNELYKNTPATQPLKPAVKTTTPQTIYKPPTPTYGGSTPTTKQSTGSKSGSDNSGCVVLFIFAILGAIAIGIASDGKLWFVGAIGGGLLGAWIHSWFK
jgi:hypothetical protein